MIDSAAYFFRLRYVTTIISKIAVTSTHGVSRKVPKNANPASVLFELALYTKSISQPTVMPYPISSQGLTFRVGNFDLTAAKIPSYIRNLRLTIATGMRMKSQDGFRINPVSVMRVVAHRYLSAIDLSVSRFIAFSIADSTHGVRSTYLSYPMTGPLYGYELRIISWQG